jgi:signal transduction histidine kinase
MPDGGELLIKLTSRRDEAIVEVIDTGGGMKPDERRKVFEAYYSTKPGGTGLGLPTTRRIIREHHGTINVQSDPGKGTRFVISLPPSGS